MSSGGNNIFEKTPCCSEQELRAYAAGTLEDNAVRRVEEHVAGCELCGEALDGFMMVPVSSTAVEDINTRIDTLTEVGPSETDKVNPYRSYWAAAAIAIVAVSFFVVMSLQERDQMILAENKVQPEESTEEITVGKPQFKGLDAEAEKELEEAVPLPPAEQLHIDELIIAEVADEPAEDDYEVEELVDAVPDIAQIEAEEEPAMENMSSIDQADLAMDEEEFKYDLDDSKVGNAHELKLYDYSDDYAQPITRMQPILGGTPITKSSKEEADDEIGGYEKQEIPYREFLDNSLLKLKQGKWKIAIRDFATILAQYPSDVNAQFYSGFAYYNINKASQALNFFSQATSNPVPLFKEEAEWYKALTLIQLGEDADAKKLLEKIAANEAGFYSTRAAELLKDRF